MRRRDVLKAGAGLAGALVAGSAEALTPHQLTFLGTAQPLQQFLNRLQTSGAWSKLIVFRLYAQPTAAAGVQNIKSPGTFDTVATNSPTFTPNRGFTGDGVSAHLLGPTFTAMIAAGISVNNISAGVFSLNTAQVAAIGISATDTASQAFGFNSSDSARQAGMRVGTTTNDTLPAANSGICHIAFSRGASGSYSAFIDRMKTTVPTASVSIPGAAKHTALRAATTYNACQIAAEWIGKTLTDADYAELDDILSTYLRQVGAYTQTRGTDGAWTWFNDPRVILVNGVPVIGAITSNGTPIIARTAP